MALLAKAGESTQKGRWFVRGRDHKKPVRFMIRPVPASVDRELRRRTYGPVKSRKAGKQSVATEMDHLEEFIVEKAVYALMESENFNIELLDDAAAAEYGTLIGGQATAGQEICFDGKLTEEVRRRLLTDFPVFAGWIADKASSITQAEVEEEEEALESF